MARTPKVVEDRREQIIDAALRVFAGKGFTKATNKDIAREAGITPGLIYYYFESKEALFNALIESRTPLRLFSSLPEQMLTLPPEPFLRLAVRQVLSIVESEDFVGLLRVLFPEIIHGENSYLREAINGGIQRVLDILHMYFVAKMRSGELRSLDGTLAEHVLFGSMMGFVLRRQLLRDPGVLALTHEQIVDAIVETVLKGLLPS